MEPTANANCSRCKRRKRPDGGDGSCPVTGVHYAILVEAGDFNGCGKFDPRPYVPRAEQLDAKLNPQEASLF